jgi:ATP synthase protein I
MRRRSLRRARNWVDVSIVGIQFPVAIALGFFWGRWMDRWLGTWPWLTGVFTLFGIVAGFVNLFRISAAAAEEEERIDAEERSDEGGEGDGAR